MTIYRIMIIDDDSNELEETFYTDEQSIDIKYVIEQGLAIYASREEYNNANIDLEDEDD